jgi:CheY-like chemotaxis protein
MSLRLKTKESDAKRDELRLLLECEGYVLTQQNARVLIVEDDPSIVDSLRFLLELERYEVLVAGNGQEALDVLAKESPVHVILLDLMMPVMDGMEFLKVLRASQDAVTAETPVIVVTASSVREVVPQTSALVRKPYDLAKLLEALQAFKRA